MAAGVWSGLTHTAAATRPDHDDPRLRGRTYAVPFEHVWQAARALCAGGLKRWTLLEEDDQEGVLRAESTLLLPRRVSDVTVFIRLDRDAQTRVDARSVSRRDGGGDLGANARRLRRFFKALDAAAEAARAELAERRAARRGARTAGEHAGASRGG